jgi:hypothetical protein
VLEHGNFVLRILVGFDFLETGIDFNFANLVQRAKVTFFATVLFFQFSNAGTYVL